MLGAGIPILSARSLIWSNVEYMQLSLPELSSVSGNIVIVLLSGCLQPAVMFSIKPFQLGRCPSRSVFQKILALCHNISTASCDEGDRSWLIRSFIGVNLIFDNALNAGWVYKCNFTPILFATSLLAITFASLFLLWHGILFFSIEHTIIPIPSKVPLPSKELTSWSTLSATNWVNPVITEVGSVDSFIISDCLYRFTSYTVSKFRKFNL